MTNKSHYIKVDSIFIGAGPSNLCAAYYLNANGYDDFLILEKGVGYEERSNAKKSGATYSLINGVGGAGLFSDGKFNFSSSIGGNPLSLMNRDSYKSSIIEMKKLLRLKRTKEIGKKIEEFNNTYGKDNIKFLEIEQAHIGTDKLPSTIRNLVNDFSNKIKTKIEVLEIRHKDGHYYVYTNDDLIYKCKNLIISVGQKGADFSKKIAKKFSVKVIGNMVDIGVRLETKKSILDPITDIQYDPKIYFNYDNCSVRTFCTNPGGEVVIERKEDYVTCNGHANSDNENEYSNTALMCRLNNIEDPRKYTEDLCKKISKYTGNKMAVQNVSNLLGKPSKITIPIKMDHVFVKMEKMYSSELSTPIIKTLRKLDEILSGNLDGLIYFPETKLYNSIIDVEKDTFKCLGNTPNLFMLGDCLGTIHGLTNACLSGFVFAKSFISKNNYV